MVKCRGSKMFAIQQVDLSRLSAFVGFRQVLNFEIPCETIYELYIGTGASYRPDLE
jgi:hypothetical protein